MKPVYWLCFCLFVFVNLLSIVLPDSLELCDRPAQFNVNSILLPQQESAKFIKKIAVDSLRSCYFHCCQLGSCSTAIFKSKAPHVCFLFDCGRNGSCTYAQHDGFDLVRLSSKVSTETAVLDEPCDEMKSCTTNNSVCLHGICVCKHGWNKKGGKCIRSICESPSLQFQCGDASTCIAIYDRCNGIIECPDGSDELGCSSVTSTRKNDTRVTSDPAEIRTPSMNYPQERRISDALAKLEELSTLPEESPRRLLDVDASENERLRPTSPKAKQRSDFSYTSPPSFAEDETTPFNVGEYRRRNLRFPIKSHTPRPDRLDLMDEQAPLFDPDYDGYRLQRSLERDRLRDDGLLAQYPIRISNMDSEIPRSRARRPRHFDAYDIRTEPERERVPSYFHELPTYHRYRPYEHSRDEILPEEELIDPSVLDRFPINKWEHTRSKFLDAPLGKKHRNYQEMNMRHFADPHNSHRRPGNHEHSVGTDPSRPTGAPVNSNDPSIHGVASSTDNKQGESESHTAALILAFSLGLVCCFVGLLFVEWRRRRRLQHWASNRRATGVPILFGDNAKLPSVRHRNQRRSKHLFGNAGNTFATEEENKALCEGLVL